MWPLSLKQYKVKLYRHGGLSWDVIVAFGIWKKCHVTSITKTVQSKMLQAQLLTVRPWHTTWYLTKKHVMWPLSVKQYRAKFYRHSGLPWDVIVPSGIWLRNMSCDLYQWNSTEQILQAQWLTMRCQSAIWYLTEKHVMWPLSVKQYRVEFYRHNNLPWDVVVQPGPASNWGKEGRIYPSASWGRTPETHVTARLERERGGGIVRERENS